jgi:O-antigen ligase
MLGMTCLVYGLGMLWQLLSAFRLEKGRERTRQLVTQSIALVMTFWLFSSADSMTSLSCFVMGGTVLVVMSLVKKARKPILVHALVAVMVGVSFSVLFLHVGEGAALEKIGRNPTLTGRTEIWTGLLKFSGNPIIGAGFDSFWLGTRLKKVWASSEFLDGINEAHNGYLETYLNLGWIGVAFLGFLIIVGYKNIMRALRYDVEIGTLRLALFVVAVVYNYTEAGFRTTGSVWDFFLLVIMAVPIAPPSQIRNTIYSQTFLEIETEEELCINNT